MVAVETTNSIHIFLLFAKAALLIMVDVNLLYLANARSGSVPASR